MASDNTAYVQDADDDTGSALGEKTYARSIAPGSPIKQKANSAKTRGSEGIRRTTSSPRHARNDSDETARPPPPEKKDRSKRPKEREMDERERKEARRRAREEEKAAERRERDRAASKKPATRPTAKHLKTAPPVVQQNHDEYRRPHFQDDPSQYGIVPAAGPRPRTMSNRHSYYGQGSRPPPSNASWYAQHPHAPNMPSPYATPPLQPQPPFAPGTSYPGPEWAPAGGAPYPMHAPPPPPPQSNEYFPPPSPSQSHLAQRFQRPTSAMGRPPSGSFSNTLDYEDYEENELGRRPSLKKRDSEARKLMPPPPRPRTSGPLRPALKGPPRRQPPSTGYDSEDFDGDDGLYHEVVPYEYGDGVMERPRSHRRGSSAYSRDGFYIEPASGGSRRNSHVGATPGSYSNKKYEAAEDAAMAYQNDVNGGPTVPLTAAALKAAKKSAAKKSKSSRSSGSSESRDESEYRQSATTRTTRSSALESEDVTIKVTGSAVVKIGNAEIQCQDGGEINITQAGRLGDSSDKGSTIFSEDRRLEDRPGRRERLPIRARASSQADSYSRSQVSGYEYPTNQRPPFF
ncbi:hypothetical protein C8035_v012241 [Colletotrichum spinosum]|uniref:Uncharacterized protein n=1 Tax=Colletotrichum spinosum TaxID=1347390 RepID=A0A4R8Q0S7_9PEZI|nr:hypothetical protein C8035_v012241 [Colletotrichum spinosum]